jgi:hypothetical protein
MTVKEAVRLYLEDKREQHSGGILLSKLTRLLEAPSPKDNKQAKPGELPVEDRDVKPGEVLGFAKWCATKQTPAIRDVPLPVHANAMAQAHALSGIPRMGAEQQSRRELDAANRCWEKELDPRR